MPEITVKQIAGFPAAVFEVRVKDGQETTHEVTLSQDYYTQLTGGSISPVHLIKKSFDFLIEHETNTAILPKFDLTQISDYFPEYEKAITKP